MMEVKGAKIVSGTSVANSLKSYAIRKTREWEGIRSFGQRLLCRDFSVESMYMVRSWAVGSRRECVAIVVLVMLSIISLIPLAVSGFSSCGGDRR